MVVYRFGQWRYTVTFIPLRRILSLFYKVAFKFVEILTGISLPCEVVLGQNVRIDHFGGIIISGYARIGDGCVIRQGVTIGLKNTEDPCAPTIGNNVDIGAGAKILGRITIGDDVKIGSNAVVLEDILSHSVAVGVPARVVRSIRASS